MAKKRKKKAYTTPKKLKHTHQKISVNKFINSINNPKCKTCNSSLAIHKNRFYCGKCENSSLKNTN
jgi:small subunit ribosomal protein S27Ae